MSGAAEEGGRVNQKRRTRTAIIAACQELITAGADINMPAVARAALVSEPTAYRYFPDLPSLLEEALAGIEPEKLAPAAIGPWLADALAALPDVDIVGILRGPDHGAKVLEGGHLIHALLRCGETSSVCRWAK